MGGTAREVGGSTRIRFLPCSPTIMAHAVASRTWSSSTLLRGLGLLQKQKTMDLAHVHDVADSDLEGMQAELLQLEVRPFLPTQLTQLENPSPKARNPKLHQALNRSGRPNQRRNLHPSPTALASMTRFLRTATNPTRHGYQGMRGRVVVRQAHLRAEPHPGIS